MTSEGILMLIINLAILGWVFEKGTKNTQMSLCALFSQGAIGKNERLVLLIRKTNS
jgi:hypothetical protein